MFIVVAYDITDDRRLKGFGTPVQYSVSECLVDERQFRDMTTMVRKTIHARQDFVRYYSLCESCRTKIKVINGSVTTVENTVII